MRPCLLSRNTHADRNDTLGDGKDPTHLALPESACSDMQSLWKKGFALLAFGQFTQGIFGKKIHQPQAHPRTRPKAKDEINLCTRKRAQSDQAPLPFHFTGIDRHRHSAVFNAELFVKILQVIFDRVFRNACPVRDLLVGPTA